MPLGEGADLMPENGCSMAEAPETTGPGVGRITAKTRSARAAGWAEDGTGGRGDGHDQTPGVH